MSVLLDTKSLAVLDDALTRFVLAFESTSAVKRKQAMLSKMERAYETAKSNQHKAERQSIAASMVANRLQSDELKVEAVRWEQVACRILEVCDLVNDGNSKR